jgi:hypothetical protein
VFFCFNFFEWIKSLLCSTFRIRELRLIMIVVAFFDFVVPFSVLWFVGWDCGFCGFYAFVDFLALLVVGVFVDFMVFYAFVALLVVVDFVAFYAFVIFYAFVDFVDFAALLVVGVVDFVNFYAFVDFEALLVVGVVDLVASYAFVIFYAFVDFVALLIVGVVDFVGFYALANLVGFGFCYVFFPFFCVFCFCVFRSRGCFFRNCCCIQYFFLKGVGLACCRVCLPIFPPSLEARWGVKAGLGPRSFFCYLFPSYLHIYFHICGFRVCCFRIC